MTQPTFVLNYKGLSGREKDGVIGIINKSGYRWNVRGDKLDRADMDSMNYEALKLYADDKVVTQCSLQYFKNEPIHTSPVQLVEFIVDNHGKPALRKSQVKQLLNSIYGKPTVDTVELQGIDNLKEPTPDIDMSLSDEKEFEDNVAEQSWYTSKGIEPIEIMKKNMTAEQFYGFLFGNSIKYITRHEDKNKVKDLEKAKVYIDWMIEEYKEGRKK